MKPVIRALALVFVLAGLARAEPVCDGRDLLPELRTERPWAFALARAYSAGVENAAGRFWRIERPGEPPSWLLGTMHTVEAVDRAITAMIRDTVAGARVVAVEISDAGMAEAEAFWLREPILPRYDVVSERSDIFTPEGRKALGAFVERRGWSLSDLAGLRPEHFYSLVIVPPCEEAALAQGRHYMDYAVVKLARIGGADVVGLDPDPNGRAYFDQIPRDVIWGYVEDTLSIYLAIPEEDVARTFSELYFRGDIIDYGRIEELMAEQAGVDPVRIAEFNQWFDAIIVAERNRLFMPGLLDALAGGNAFVVVGAAHLPGSDGLVALLREAGYTVTGADAGTAAKGD